MRTLLAVSVLILCVLQPQHLAAQASASLEAQTSSPKGEQGSALDHWWLGAAYRHVWVPPYVTDAFFARAPSISNDGFGLLATYRNGSGFNLEMGAGYLPYEFAGSFIADDGFIEDAELIESDLKFAYVTGTVSWDIPLHKVVAFEIGLGLDLGVVLGDLTRNEAYFDSATGEFVGCKAPLKPALRGPNDVPYCNVPENGSYNPATGSFRSDKDVKGEQYNVKEGRIPPLMLFPMLPHLALRVQPLDFLMLKAEFAFGGVQMWVGASLHVSLGALKPAPKPAPVAEPKVVTGRVLGKVVEAEGGAPIGGATVRAITSAQVPVQSNADGTFVIAGVPVGRARFQITHPHYADSKCEADIPSAGGDVALACPLAPPPRVGAISGQVVDEAGAPITPASITLVGPTAGDTPRTTAAGAEGYFAAVDLPVGTYLARVEADGYLVSAIKVDVVLQDTAMPKVVLIKKPEHALVELRKQELAIVEQIQFMPKSAEIAADSEGLLRQVADALHRHPELELVEIQGHTDPSGGRAMNMPLSQQRAESVRAWLVSAGVAESRLVAKGYGPDKPLVPNTSAANRAKNRRVQFIIVKQGAPVVQVKPAEPAAAPEAAPAAVPTQPAPTP
jgi:outer membrane protein OmpA-like peptidoglycan-associated protein